MLILPKPAKDEFALGFIGRLCHVNLVKSYFEMMRALLVHYQLESAAGAYLNALAKVSGMDIGDFVFSHTLSPLTVQDCRVYAGRHNVHSIGGERNPLRLIKKFAYFCPNCFEQQHQDVGFPYWNRVHQLPGIYWCPWHQAPLLGSNGLIMQKQLPAINAAHIDISLSVDKDLENPVLQRYIQTMMSLLSHTAHRPLHELKLLIRSKALDTGLQVEKQQPAARYLSDVAYDCCPAWWLQKVFHRYSQPKSPGRYFQPIDGALLPTEKVSTPAYALAIVLLLDSGSQYMN